MQFLFGFVSRSFFLDFWVEISKLGGPNSRFTHGEFCKNEISTETVFHGFRGRLILFWRPWEQFVWLLLPETKLENSWIF